MTMNKFTQKVQELGQKAAQIKQVIENVPPRLAEAREVVLTTGNQLQQLRDEVKSSASSLRMEDHNHLLQSLRQVDGSKSVFHDAGYDLSSVELELGINQRLVVHLEKVKDVGHDSIQVLMLENAQRKVTHSILAALIKAEDFSSGASLGSLSYHKVAVYIGPAPVIRLCWTANRRVDVAPLVVVPATSAPLNLPAPSAFTQTSYFEQRAPAPASPAPVGAANLPPAAPAPVIPPAVKTELPATPPADWRRDALARFKKMPDLTKR